MSEVCIRDAGQGVYLADYDPDFVPPPERPRYPNGLVHWTTDPAKAMRFPDARAAWRCWMTQSTTMPYRPDGQPNRPLTAFTIYVEPITQPGART